MVIFTSRPVMPRLLITIKNHSHSVPEGIVSTMLGHSSLRLLCHTATPSPHRFRSCPSSLPKQPEHFSILPLGSSSSSLSVHSCFEHRSPSGIIRILYAKRNLQDGKSVAHNAFRVCPLTSGACGWMYCGVSVADILQWW